MLVWFNSDLTQELQLQNDNRDWLNERLIQGVFIQCWALTFWAIEWLASNFFFFINNTSSCWTPVMLKLAAVATEIPWGADNGALSGPLFGPQRLQVDRIQLSEGHGTSNTTATVGAATWPTWFPLHCRKIQQLSHCTLPRCNCFRLQITFC